MIKVHSSGIAMKVKVFSGEPQQVEEAISTFLAERHIKMHGFAQSQSSDTSGAGVTITTTILYSEYSGEKKEVVGFSRP